MIEALRYLKPMDVRGFQKVRVGGPADGGYVMLDDFENIAAAYSLGVGEDISWDLDIAGRGIPVFQYDHTIKFPPSGHSLIKWSPIGVSSNSGEGFMTIDEMITSHYSVYNTSLILKMDVEGVEYKAITHRLWMFNFKQIVCEFHSKEKHWSELGLKKFKLLNYSHQVIHVHANNCGMLVDVDGVMIPDTIEVTWVRRSDYNFAMTSSAFPGPFDRPNDARREDYSMDWLFA